jgi:hypothetical protein
VESGTAITVSAAGTVAALNQTRFQAIAFTNKQGESLAELALIFIFTIFSSSKI